MKNSSPKITGSEPSLEIFYENHGLTTIDNKFPASGAQG
jgi:hypothetical protein